MNDALYAATLPFICLQGDKAVFGGDPKLTLPPQEEFGDITERPMTPAEFVIDRRFWEILGRPEQLCVGISNEIGWEKHVGPLLPSESRVGLWLEGVSSGA